MWSSFEWRGAKVLLEMVCLVRQFTHKGLENLPCLPVSPNKDNGMRTEAAPNGWTCLYVYVSECDSVKVGLRLCVCISQTESVGGFTFPSALV